MYTILTTVSVIYHIQCTVVSVSQIDTCFTDYSCLPHTKEQICLLGFNSIKHLLTVN